MREINREELAWAAGFYDGEGCCYPARGRKGILTSPQLAISQVDRGVLDRFQRAVGLGRVNGPYKQPNLKHRDQYRWVAQSFEHVQAVVAMLWPFLGSIKRGQAGKALKAYTTSRKTG